MRTAGSVYNIKNLAIFLAESDVALPPDGRRAPWNARHPDARRRGDKKKTAPGANPGRRKREGNELLPLRFFRDFLHRLLDGFDDFLRDFLYGLLFSFRHFFSSLQWSMSDFIYYAQETQTRLSSVPSIFPLPPALFLNFSCENRLFCFPPGGRRADEARCCSSGDSGLMTMSRYDDCG